MIDTTKILADIARMMQKEGDTTANVLRSAARRNTGAAQESIKWLTYNNNVSVWGSLHHAEHLRYAIDGRRAGKMPPDAPIRAWLASKGWRDESGNVIPKLWQRNSAVYAIRKAIADNGTKHQQIGLYDSILNDLKTRIMDGVKPHEEIIKQIIGNISPVTINEHF